MVNLVRAVYEKIRIVVYGESVVGFKKILNFHQRPVVDFK